MRTRKHTVLLALALVLTLASCKRKAPVDETPEVPVVQQETEPNNAAVNASVVSEEVPLEGVVSPNDTDVLQPASGRSVRLVAAATVRIFAVHEDGRRVEIGFGLPQGGTHVHLPGAAWSMELTGEGAWSATLEPDAEDDDCGFRPGSVASPVQLVLTSLPAEFPLCLTPSSGAVLVQLPEIRPAGTVGAIARVDGADASITGTFRVNGGQRTLAEVSLEHAVELPPVRWIDGQPLTVVLQAQASVAQTGTLRIEALASPRPGEIISELEPNDNAVDALALTSRTTVSGSIYHRADLDRLRIEPLVGAVRVEVLSAEAPLRIEAGSEVAPIPAVQARQGVWDICRLDPVSELGEIRISLDPTSTVEEPVVYQVNFSDPPPPGNELPDGEELVVPDGIPWGTLGISAGEAGVLASVDGGIFPAGDVDQWLLLVPPATGVVASLQTTRVRVSTNSVLDLKVRLLDGDRVPIASADRASAGQAEEILMDLPEGYYVVEVSGSGAAGCNASYRVEVAYAGENGAAMPPGGGETRERDRGLAPPEERSVPARAPVGTGDGPLDDYPW